MTLPGCFLIQSRVSCGVNNKYDNFSDYVAFAPVKRVIVCSAQLCSGVAHYDSAQPDRRSVLISGWLKHTHCIMHGCIIRFSYNTVTLNK
jgi:hypothetical protein